ncbi:MAG: hypothetical protein JNN26_25380 [Candidatus Obscuribacter sp.]|nr:hypothetical protein [Candidatus Obscuribacter sp.]
MKATDITSAVGLKAGSLLIGLPVFLVFLFDLLSSTGDISPWPAMRLTLFERFRSGALPYSDFFSFDTPPALFLGALPAALHQMLAGLGFLQPLVLVFKLSVFLAVALSLVASLGILCFALETVQAERKRELMPLTLGFTFSFLAANYLVRFQFGDLQHLFCLALLPYLFLRACSYMGVRFFGPLSFLLGFLAALAASLDLLFVPVFVICELVLAAVSGKLRFDKALLGVGLGFCLAVASLFTLPEASRAAFFEICLPLRLAKLLILDEILAFVKCAPDLRFYLILFGVALVNGFLLLSRSRLLAPLLSLMIMGLLLFAVEAEGFSSELVVLVFSSAFVLGLNLFQWLSPFSGGRLYLPGAILFSCLASYGFYTVNHQALDQSLSVSSELRRNGAPDLGEVLDQNSRIGDNVLVVCDFPSAIYPALLYYDRRQYGYLTTSKPLHLYRVLRQIGPTNMVVNNACETIIAKVRRDLDSGKIALLLVHKSPEEEDMRCLGLAFYLDNRFANSGNAYYYSRARAPREAIGYLFPFHVYLPRTQGGKGK